MLDEDIPLPPEWQVAKDLVSREQAQPIRHAGSVSDIIHLDEGG